MEPEKTDSTTHEHVSVRLDTDHNAAYWCGVVEGQTAMLRMIAIFALVIMWFVFLTRIPRE